MIAILAAAAVLLTGSATFAKNGGGGNGGNHSGGSNKSSGFKLNFNSSSNKSLSNPTKSFSFNNPSKSINFNNPSKSISFNNSPKSLTFLKKDHCDNHDCYKPCYNGHCYPYYNYRCYYPSYGCIRTIDTYAVGQAFEPFHSTYICQPGDSFYTVSLKEYGTSSNSRYIAQFNRMVESSALVPGQTLMLPSISANGALLASRAPAAGAEFNGAFNQTFNSPVNTTPTFTTPVSFSNPTSFTPPVNTTTPPAPPRAKVAVGSTLLVDGQAFGDKSGSARLSVSGLSLPVEVLEWSTGAVKIRLPKLEVSGPAVADLEVVRADGSVASKTGVELTTASVQVALGK
jgi:hypothetical protein